MAILAFVNRADKDPNIGIGEKLAYGLGDFASQLMYIPVGMLLMYYYTEYVNINIASVATIMLLSRVFDGVSDVIVGWFIEKTNSPYGKSRVWILRMLIPFFVATVLLFSVPVGWDYTAKLIYVFFTYNIAVTVVYTAINLPYGAMSTAMTKNSYQRSIIIIYRMLLATAGNTLALSATLPLVHFFGNDARAWTYTFMVLMSVACICFFITFYFCHERVVSSSKQNNHMGFKAIKNMFKNKYWLMLTLSIIFMFSADMMIGAVNVYYLKYFLHNADLVGIVSVIMNIAKVAAMIVFLPYCIKTVGKCKALLLACLIMIISFVLRFFIPDSQTIAFFTLGLMGLAQGFTYACCFAMIPDTVEYSEYLDNERHEGLIYAGASFGTKLAAGLSAIIPGFIMDAGGYVNGAVSQSSEAMSAILYVHTLVPCGMYIIAFITMSFYKLDVIYADIIKEIGIRHAKKAILDN